MSVYDKVSNGRGRHEESTFVGGCGPIAKGAMHLLRWNSERQWSEDGCPEEEVDPSNPYWALQTYKTYISCRTVAELERLIEATKWSGWAANRRDRPPKKYAAYTVYWSYKRQAMAVDRAHIKLVRVLGHIKRLQEENGAMPYGVDCDGNCQGFRAINIDSKADEAEAALMTFDFMGGFDG